MRTLLAFDAHGTAKRVAEMSKGTRFQLYLALRAAAHPQMVRTRRLPAFLLRRHFRDLR